jgi:hypothetical protein
MAGEKGKHVKGYQQAASWKPIQRRTNYGASIIHDGTAEAKPSI